MFVGSSVGSTGTALGTVRVHDVNMATPRSGATAAVVADLRDRRSNGRLAKKGYHPCGVLCRP